MNNKEALINKSNWLVRAIYDPAEIKDNQYLMVQHISGFSCFIQSYYAKAPEETLELIASTCRYSISKDDWSELLNYIKEWIDDLNTDFY